MKSNDKVLKKLEKIIAKANEYANNKEFSTEVIEFHMKRLFYHSEITEESVAMYNRLERLWKNLYIIPQPDESFILYRKELAELDEV